MTEAGPSFLLTRKVAIVAARLTDKQHKKIIARYAECQNYSQVAREFGVSESTIRAHCKRDPETAKKAEDKKQQNTRDVLEYLDARRDKLQDVLDLGFEALSNPEKYQRASLQSVATMMGILIDKYTQLAQFKAAGGNGSELLQSLLDLERQHGGGDDGC